MEANEVCVAAFKGDIPRLAALLHRDPSLLLSCDSRGRTALHRAVAGRHLMMVKYLIGHWQADKLLDVQDDAGDTPLHARLQAVENHDDQMVLSPGISMNGPYLA